MMPARPPGGSVRQQTSLLWVDAKADLASNGVAPRLFIHRRPRQFPTLPLGERLLERVDLLSEPLVVVPWTATSEDEGRSGAPRHDVVTTPSSAHR
jgi:hypothetical protein